MTAQMHIGLAELLRRHNISQKQLAEAAGMRPATVNALFRARIERVELGTLVDLVTGLRRLGIKADVGDILQVVDEPDEAEQAARERALRLLGGEPWGLKPKGLAEPVPVSDPPVEDLLPDLLGPSL
ncbi:DNA-binding transcriptional regulator, XRE family [Deinococcus reticulitermitis]|uniref:DNA-binding transcriptional regulator, XRE family n=1 Tax=Deinococcus reticulitermitis TaxID=856736 RepID=A0A1H6UTY9_9DEIO|nr:helix-turn-helix transcriptional regulator [Deinococcus reticulitermitis]SEI91525.1 DNA-binding transcriptional regulator, XRE family [Deinococcus reticulitermitis]